MNRIFIKRIFPFVLAAGLVLGLGGCSQRVPEQGDVPDSIDELSEGMTSDKEEEPQQPEPPQEQSLQQSNEEKNPLEDQLAGEKPEDKPEEEEPAKETEEKKRRGKPADDYAGQQRAGYHQTGMGTGWSDRREKSPERCDRLSGKVWKVRCRLYRRGPDEDLSDL